MFDCCLAWLLVLKLLLYFTLFAICNLGKINTMQSSSLNVLTYIMFVNNIFSRNTFYI